MDNVCSVEVIPVRAAVARNEKTKLDSIIRLVVAEGESSDQRTPVNIGLVIDRSGSMQGIKLQYAIEAANYAVDQLKSADKVSVVAYDDRVRTVFKATHPKNKDLIKLAINQISAGNSTALHAGWVQGGIEVSEALEKEYMNRVLLLSDGLANVGVTDPSTIEKQVRGLVERGVSTSTIGVGEDYNEDLMSAMARGGSGNYWFIKTPQQLPSIFRQELQGLSAVVGKKVELKIVLKEGVESVKIYNELASIDEHTWRVPDLQMGQTVDVLARFEIEPTGDPCSVCDISISWDDAGEKNRENIDTDLVVKVVTKSELSSYPVDADVQEQVALFKTAKMKEEAVALFDSGDTNKARLVLKKAQLGLSKYPASPLLEAEMASFDELDRHLSTRKFALYRKSSHYQSYGYSHSHFHSQLHFRLCEGPVVGDITQPPPALNMPVEAIVNSCDSRLSDAGYLSSAIHKAAGPELLEECMTIGRCGIGKAKITKAYNLPVNWIIHTVCPMWLGGKAKEVQALRSCYLNILKLASQHNIRTIAIPAIGTGAMQFPVEIAAENAFEIVGMYLSQSRTPAAVLFICHDEATLNTYRKAYSNIVGVM
jgi:Ca-activated chloride channel family protein